jgi:hypothetical protein
MNKLVYIGSNTDIIPIILLHDIKEFIYIDSSPQSEYGMYLYESGELYRHHFLPDLDKVLTNNNFKLVQKKTNYLEYNNNIGQTLKYHINTPFPEKMNNDILKEIDNSQNLYISGFDPNKIILNYMPYLKNIYCSTHTVYDCPIKEYESDFAKANSLFHELVSNKKKYDFNYFLIKEKIKFEYWIIDNITPDIKNIYEINKCNGLRNFFVDF